MILEVDILMMMVVMKIDLMRGMILMMVVIMELLMVIMIMVRMYTFIMLMLDINLVPSASFRYKKEGKKSYFEKISLSTMLAGMVRTKLIFMMRV